MIEFNGPDGIALEFPDDTPDATILSAVRRWFGNEPHQVELKLWDICPHPRCPEEVAFVAEIKLGLDGVARRYEFQVVFADQEAIFHGWRHGSPPWSSEPASSETLLSLITDGALGQATAPAWIQARMTQFSRWVADHIAAGWDWRETPPALRH